MKSKAILFALLLLATGRTAWAEHWTKTYIFEGSQDSQIQNSGYFYEEGSQTHYNGSPSPWTIGSTGSLSFTLSDAVTLTLSSSTSHIYVHKDNGLVAGGSATLTLGGGRYFYHVRIIDGNGNVVGFDANGNPVANQGDAVMQADYWGLSQGFTHTFSNGIGIKKIEIFYGNTPYLEDIATGSGTSSDDPYVITNTTMMEAFARSVAASHTFEGKFVTLGADLAYSYSNSWNRNSTSESNYTAIGGVGRPFEGTFDGQGHTVSGIRIYRGGETDDDTNQGLFGYIGSGGTVKNVILRDTFILGYRYNGGIVGYNSGTVAKCYVVNALVISSYNQDYGFIAGHQEGGATELSFYRDCAIYSSNSDFGLGYLTSLYVIRPGTGVGVTRTGGSVLGTSGVTIYEDGVTEGSTEYYLKDATVIVSPASGYPFSSVVYRYTGPGGHMLNKAAKSYDDGTWRFTMPASDVTVSASVSNIILTAHPANLADQSRYWTTFYHPISNYLLPSGAQAFTMGFSHTLYRIGDGSIIPADCAVVIMADSASIELTATDASAPSLTTDNILYGTSTATAAPDGARVLSQVGETFGFFQFVGEIPANKAYYVE